MAEEKKIKGLKMLTKAGSVHLRMSKKDKGLEVDYDKPPRKYKVRGEK